MTDRPTPVEEVLAGMRGRRFANADQLQGRAFSSEAPNDGDYAGWDATNKKWRPLSGILDVDTSEVDVANTSTETSIYSHSIAADTIAANGGFRLTLGGDMLANGGGSVIVRVKLGATTVATSNATTPLNGADRYRWHCQIVCIAPTTSSQNWNGFIFGRASSNSFAIADISGTGSHWGGALNVVGSTEDLTTDLTLDITVDWSAASASDSFRKEIAVLERLGLGVAGASAAAAGGAPTDADYLVGTANGDLSAEIVVGATPGGELGGTWPSPTVDATHSGSAHHAQAHGPAQHTTGTAWRLLYLDTNGDETELALGTDGQRLVATGASTAPAFEDEIAPLVFIIDGGGSAITTGQKGHVEVPFAGTITGWTILGDQSGSIVVDVWKDTYANFPPTVADTIAGSEKPTLSSAQKNQDLALGTWTTAVTAGDILAFNVDSITTVTRVSITLRIKRT